ncbi:hypothetical protein QVD17_30817 [Tagetes erecta]|uniref:Uncharacterized protein n=1 Tax=Tagetes erecta TaxID=13708 RepID=A0AAD8K6B2_TARER|nr:hypothetical protein QVD17_30817 [Tagetes erecta]
MNVSVQPSKICAKVSGFDLEFTEADVARILRLEDDVGEEVSMKAEEVYGAFRTAGYEGPMPGEKKMEFVNSYLIQEWRYIAHVFIMCLDHRKGGTDGLNLDWARAMMLFCRGQKANLPKVIYNYMLENIHATKGSKWLMYPRFIQMILNDKLPNLPVVGEVLNIWSMHSRIFGDCKSVRSDCVGRIAYLWENMYPADRWVHIQRLMEIDRKRGGENIEVVEKKAEIDAGRENRTKRKSDAPTKAAKKAKHDDSGKSTETVSELKGEIESLKSEIVDLKSRYADLETKDAEKLTVITEMGRMIRDQQCLIVRIFKELNSLKEKDGSDPAMSELELKSLTDAAKYPLMQSEFGDKDRGKTAEELFDEDMGIDLDEFTGPEVVVRTEPEVDVNADSEEDLENEPERDEEVVPEVPIFQNIDEPNTSQLDRQVIAWKYNGLLDAYMIKRRGGDICYIKNRKHFATLPRWDLRRLAELPLLGKEDSGRACAFEVTIRRAAENNFFDFGYQKPKRMRQKKDRHWVSWKGKVVLKIEAPKIMTRVRVPDTQPPRLQDFLKWFYDNSTGEAVIRLKGEDRPEIRLFDPMEVFSFCDEDLKVLCENRIKHGTGDDTRTEANLFVKVTNKARGIRAELRSVNERLRMTDDQNMDIDDLSRQLDESIERRFEKLVEVIELDVIAEFLESLLVFSEDDEAGSEDVTNLLAGIESRAGAYIENF